MPSKESLERAAKWLQGQVRNMRSANDFRPSHIPSLADLLDEAIRAEAEWWVILADHRHMDKANERLAQLEKR